MNGVMTVGEILVDILTKKIGQRLDKPGELLGPYPSEAPAIFIDQVAKMNVNGTIIAKVGDDGFGKLNIGRLEKDGVDTSNIIVSSEYTTGTAFATYYEDGSRDFIFHFPYSAAGNLIPEEIEEDIFNDYKYLHIMGCSISASPSMRRAVEKAVNLAGEHGLTISFDPNIRKELLKSKDIIDSLHNMLSNSDIILTGKKEIEMMFENKSLDNTISLLKEMDVSIIIIKNGAEGINVYSKDDNFFVPPYQVEEVDPTGAGDCFDGVFIASMAEGINIRRAAQLAAAAGALSVTKKGPMEGTVNKEVIIDFIEDYS